MLLISIIQALLKYATLGQLIFKILKLVMMYIK